MTTGLELDQFRKIEELAHNTKIIAEQLAKLNETLTCIMLELLNKNEISKS